MTTIDEFYEYFKQYHCWIKEIRNNVYEIQIPAQYTQLINKILSDNRIYIIEGPTIFQHGFLKYFSIVINLTESDFN